MELRHLHRNEQDVAGEEKARREREVEPPRWPGKRSLTQGQNHADVDARAPDLRRIRAALGSLRSGGQTLPGEMTAQYSQLLGLDLSDVRIHRGGVAGQAAKSLEATAFTAGTNIAIADHLDLDSAFGRHVIAHELVHVAQNKRGNAPMDLAAHMEIGPSGSAIELEAERGAAALTRGESFTVQAHGRLPGISRYSDDETPPPGGGSAPTTLPNRTPPPVKPDNTPTPTTQPTTAAPAAPPAAPPPPATAAPTAQPRPSDQPANTPQAPATPAPGTPGYNQPSGSAPATNPTSLPNREPRPAPPDATAVRAGSLDARVLQELETRADPTLKAGYARAVAGVDSLRIQALQYAFTPNGIWNTLVETFTAKNAFQDHFGQIYSANAYRGGKSWVDTAQAWIEGLRGVVHIIGDVASVVSAWAGMAALVTGALALILSETVIGGIALGAIAAIAAEIALVAGAIKLLTDIIDLLLGIIQMIILVVRARNSKDPAERARFAALLKKESSDFGANVVSIGVQVAVMAVSAGIGAGLSRGANSFMSAFKDEFSKMITPALKPWTLGNNFRNIARMATPVAVGTGVRAGRTVLQVEVDQGLVGINRQARVGNRITRTREVIPFTARNQMNGARLVTMRNAVGRAVIVNAGGVAVGLGGGQLQADIKQPRADRGGTSGSSPAGGGGRLNAPSQPAGADLSKVSMWPSQIEAFQNAKGPLQGAADRTQRQYDMAESQAGPELGAQVRQAFQGANNQAGQMRFGAMQVQTDAREGQANTQRGLQQAGQGRDQQNRMGVTQTSANRNVQRIQGEGAKLQSPPPKEGVLGWLYNQTIGRIGGWIGSAQKWVTNLVGKWAMSLAGFSKDEMDIAGIENDMRADDKKDQNSTQEAQDAATRADQIQQTVFTLQENKTRDEQYAIQAMADSQRFIQAIEDADRQLAAAIANGQSYIAAVTPVLAHELSTEAAGASIDAQYVAPLVAYATSFTDSIDASNVGTSARADGTGALNQMKAAYPELDIAPGTTAIGNAGAQYDTAFAQLAGQARTQVATMQTAVQAFIGTQDYDGVGGNAAALDALAADFDRSAQTLADQLYAAINGVITQYNGHVQRAIDEANQVPADQADPVAAPPPPDAPADVPPTDDGGGFASGYATARTGVSPNPDVVSETKAPVADNAAKPANSDAAKAEQAATPPEQPAVPAENPAVAGGEQKPAANDGSPAKDDPAKAGSVDNKPKSDAPGAPATAKPVGTPKSQANKAEADKTDADKLDLPAAPSPDAGGGDAGSEPSGAPQPNTGARSASKKPQETPIEQPITSAVAETSNAGGKPKTEAEKKEKKPPNRKTDTGGGQSTSGSVAPVADEDDEGDEVGDVQGYGTDAGMGYVGGEGQPALETGTPAERANGGTNAGSVTHQTEVADNRAADRTDVGVGERVQFTADQAGAWSGSANGPGGRATAANAAEYTWTAPAVAGGATISFTPSGGTAQTFSFTVIAPTGVDFETPQEKSYGAGVQGAGMITNVRFQPNTVSFHRTKWKEIAGPASGKDGYFEDRTVRDHAPNPQWLRIGSDNGGPTDDAYFTGWPSPWTEGGFDYVIPNHYLVDGESGAGHFILDITQAHRMTGDGTSTITKGTASATRSPGTAPPRRGRGRGGGFGSEGAVGGSAGGNKTPKSAKPKKADLASLTATYEEAGKSTPLTVDATGAVKAGGVDVAAKADTPKVIGDRIKDDVKKFLASTTDAERKPLIATIKADLKLLAAAMAKARGEDKAILNLRTTFEKDIGAKAFAGIDGFEGADAVLSAMSTSALQMIAKSRGASVAAGAGIDAIVAQLKADPKLTEAIESIGMKTNIGYAGSVGKVFDDIVRALTQGSVTQKAQHLISFGDKFLRPQLISKTATVLDEVKANLVQLKSTTNIDSKIQAVGDAAGNKDATKEAEKGMFSTESFQKKVNAGGPMDDKTPEVPIEALDRSALFRLAKQEGVKLEKTDTNAAIVEKLKGANVKPTSNALMSTTQDTVGLTEKRMPYLEGIKANMLNPDHDWITKATDGEMPLKAGISGTAARFVGLGELLGVGDKPRLRLAMLGHLQAIEAHSFWEICDAVDIGPERGKYVPFAPVSNEAMEGAARQTLQKDAAVSASATGEKDAAGQVKRLLGTSDKTS